VFGHLLVRTCGLAFEDHLPISYSTFKDEQESSRVDPRLMPNLTRRVIDVEALPTVSATRVVAFMQDAAANLSLDAVRTGELAIGTMDIPLADPEVKGPMLGGCAGRWIGLCWGCCSYAEREGAECDRGQESHANLPGWIPRPNVRAKRAPAAGRQGPVGENVPCTADRALVACRWCSA
jgi:hypothetical protein